MENNWTSEQVAKYPQRLLGFCSVNPLRPYALKRSHASDGRDFGWERSLTRCSLPTGLALVLRAVRFDYLTNGIRLRSTPKGICRYETHFAGTAKLICCRIQKRVQRLFHCGPNYLVQMRLYAPFIDLSYRT